MAKSVAIAGVGSAERESEVFESLVRQHDRQIYNIALRMTGNPEEAKDLMQDALIKAFRAFKTWKGETPFTRWLYRIISNLYIDQLRKKKGRYTVSIDEAVEYDDSSYERAIPDSSNCPELIAESNELQQKIQDALKTLPPEFRLAVILCDIQGFSYAEISDIMHCSIGTVRSRIHRARKLIRDQLKGYIDFQPEN